MGDLTLTEDWPNIHRLERTTPALGHDPANAAVPLYGADGPMNLPAKQVGCRTEYVRARLERSQVVAAVHGTTEDLQVSTRSRRAIRVVAGEVYAGAGETTLLIPAGEMLVINECRWPLRVRGPSGVEVVVPARTPPNAATAAAVFADALDTQALATSSPAMRPVDITAFAPDPIDSAAVTPVVITGKGFLGAIDVQVALNSIAYTVVSDTEIHVSVDGPAIGAVPGPNDVQVFRDGGEWDIHAFTFS